MALKDLRDWKYFYLAGRLQKPVKWIKFPLDPQLVDSINENFLSAITASLLLLKDKERISLLDLYLKIISLSYVGDIRMKIAEDPQKFLKILTTTIPTMSSKIVNSDKICSFDDIYCPSFSQIGDIDIISDPIPISYIEAGSEITEPAKNIIVRLENQYISFPRIPSFEKYLFSHLPREIKSRVPFSEGLNFPKNLSTCKDLAFANYLNLGISRKVLFSSTCQSLKGVFSAGPTKSFNYALRKISKRFLF